ncbi:efflux RND transporter periplasmic adaptor subunit [Treponema sp.]|uniref:efflux RND transporter periplasmic adaptor subunit n=1 Tax=Treponema sp. TaxID=166 RepID=UPI003F11EB0A
MKAKLSFIVISVICVFVLAVSFLALKFSPEKKPGGFKPMERPAEAVTVRTMPAERGTLHAYVDTNGEIECERNVDCYPDIGGKIAKVYVSLGDVVKKGDVLAEVDPSEPGLYYVNSSVYAPISGTVTSTPKETGTTVTSSTSITTIGDVSNLQIRAKIPERYVSFLVRGLKARISLEAYPSDSFSASVKKVSPVLDSASRTKEIVLVFDNADPRINAGMFAKLTLFTADYSGEIIVPSNCVIERNSHKCVFVLSDDGDSVSMREVELGVSVDSMVQVLSGIYEGERIVTEGMSSLLDGSSVRDVSSAAGREKSNG